MSSPCKLTCFVFEWQLFSISEEARFCLISSENLVKFIIRFSFYLSTVLMNEHDVNSASLIGSKEPRSHRKLDSVAFALIRMAASLSWETFALR